MVLVCVKPTGVISDEEESKVWMWFSEFTKQRKDEKLF